MLPCSMEALALAYSAQLVIYDRKNAYRICPQLPML
jgi:hypothetical protein